MLIYKNKLNIGFFTYRYNDNGFCIGKKLTGADRVCSFIVK